MDAAGTNHNRGGDLPRPARSGQRRGRAKVLFGFDYIWEVSKPAHQRKFGYYALPVLWGDRLVARCDSKLDRTTNTFVVLSFWLEDSALGKDEAFAEALARVCTLRHVPGRE